MYSFVLLYPYPRGKSLRYAVHTRLGVAQGPSGRIGKEERVLAVTDTARSVVTTDSAILTPLQTPCNRKHSLYGQLTSNNYMVLSERSWLVTLLGRFMWSGHLLYCQSVGVGLSYALFVLVTTYYVH
jgi:hypothetical protein